jgi:hypothetical protein
LRKVLEVCVDQKKADGGARAASKGRGHIRGAELADGRFGDLRPKLWVRHIRRKVGHEADNRETVAEPYCLLDFKLDKELEELFLDIVRHIDGWRGRLVRHESVVLAISEAFAHWRTWADEKKSG